MARGVNKAILIGNLGQDPTIRYTPDGKAVASFSLATNEQWKGKDGEKQERTEWHRVVTFGKLAEIVEKYLTKGAQIYLEGRMQTRKWQDKQGQDRYTTEIIGDQMKMLGTRSGGETRDPREPNEYAQAKGRASTGAPAQPEFDDEIPF